MASRFDRLFLVLPGWLAFMLFLPSLTHGFVWDDTYFLTDTPYLRDPALWWQHIREPLFVSRNYFRPLPLLAFVAEARLGDLSPFVFHLANVALHAANATLVVLLARSLGVRPGPAGLAGLLFAVHPALVENVCWISDRFDLMMTFFLLAALLCDRRLASPLLRGGAVGLLFLCALLSKETAVVFLALLPLWQAMRHADADWRAWPRLWLTRDAAVWAALWLSLAAYLAVRFLALGYLFHSDAEMLTGTFLQHGLLIGKTLGWYGVLALFPFGAMNPVHPASTPIAIDDSWAWLGLLASGIACLAGLLLLARRPALRRVVLAGAMALAALAPTSNLVPLTIGDNLVHDRYLILPIAFLSLAAVLALGSRPWRPLAGAAAAAWCAACIAATASLIPRWEDNLSLWSWASSKAPESRIAGVSYLSALVNAGRNEETVSAARSLLVRFPDNGSAEHNLALALARLGRFDEAGGHVRRAIELFGDTDPKGRLDIAEAWNLLGYIELSRDRDDAAATALANAAAAMPELARAHYNLARLHYRRGAWQAGDEELAVAVRYGSPDLADAFRRLGAESKRAARARLDATP